MAGLKWLASFETGNKVLDDDHKELIDFLDEIKSALAAGSAEGARDLVEVLIANVRKHFVREEAILTEAGYPRVKGHHIHHIRILERAGTIRENFNSASGQHEFEKVYEELVSFLIADIIEADNEFKSFLQHSRAES